VSGRPPEPEHYVAVPAVVLQAIAALWMEDETDRISIGTAKLLLRSVRYDQIAGNLVLGVRVVRSLDDEPAERGLDSI
jgi:hypothetical protein